MIEASRPIHAERSLFARTLDTPIWDLMRGRINPRGDYQRALAESDLDIELQQELAQRVQKAAWGRGRRVRLAQSLVAVCRQQLSDGREPSALASSLRDAPDKPRGVTWFTHLSKLLLDDLPNDIQRLLDQITEPIQSRQLHAATQQALSDQWAVLLREGTTTAELREQFTTPDVVGKLVNQLQSEDVLWTSELPGEVSRLVHDVIKRSRLWPAEKRDVASELAEHFASGVEAGESSASLLASFGDPSLAARLIRRAKLRCRPWHWQAWRRTCQLTMVGVAGFLLLWLVLMVRMSRKPTIGVNFVAQFDERISAIPQADRAWPLYRDGLVALSPRPHNAMYDVSLHGSEGEHWPRAKEFLQANSESLELFLEASKLPQLGFRFEDRENADWLVKEGCVGPEPRLYDPNDSIMYVLLPHAQSLGDVVSDLLRCVMLDAEQHGDGRRAIEMLKSMIRVSGHIAETSDYLVSKRLGRIRLMRAGSEFLRLLGNGTIELNDEDLRVCHSLFESAWDRTKDGPAMGADFGEDLLQRIFTDDGDGGGRVTSDGMKLLCDSEHSGISLHDPLEWIAFSSTDSPNSPRTLKFNVFSPVAASLIASRSEVKSVLDDLQLKLQRDMRVPYWQQYEPQFKAAYEQLLSNRLSRIKYAPAVIIFAHNSELVETGRLLSATQTNLKHAWFVAIALEIYRRPHDVWPASLDVLVAERLLPELPIDQFDGEPLRYKLDANDQPLLYSVGPDQQDNFAETLYARIDATTPKSSKLMKGDWSLLPVE